MYTLWVNIIRWVAFDSLIAKIRFDAYVNCDHGLISIEIHMKRDRQNYELMMLLLLLLSYCTDVYYGKQFIRPNFYHTTNWTQIHSSNNNASQVGRSLPVNGSTALNFICIIKLIIIMFLFVCFFVWLNCIYIPSRTTNNYRNNTVALISVSYSHTLLLVGMFDSPDTYTNTNYDCKFIIIIFCIRSHCESFSHCTCVRAWTCACVYCVSFESLANLTCLMLLMLLQATYSI